MSRLDKRLYHDAQLGMDDAIGADADELRLFAFSRHVKGYQPEFSPQQPILIFKSKKAATEQHPCAQWLGLAEVIYQKNPTHRNSIFVLDATSLSAEVDKEDEASPTFVGHTFKRLANFVCRLNCAQGKFVAAGVSAVSCAKLVLLSHRTTNSRGGILVDHLVLVCPKNVEKFEALVLHVAKHRGDSGASNQKRKLTVLLNADHEFWARFSSSPAATALFASVRITPLGSDGLFASIARACEVDEVETSDVDPGTSSMDPGAAPVGVFAIKFALSRYTKQVEQIIEPSGIADWNHDAIHAHRESVPSLPEPAQGALPSPSQPPPPSLSSSEGNLEVPLAELEHARSESIRADLFVVDAANGIVGNSQGRFGLANPAALRGHENGVALRTTVQISRTTNGKMRFRVSDDPRTAKVLTRADVEASPVLPSSSSDVPCWWNASSVQRSYGVLIIRGHQCVLVRSLSREYAGMRFPVQFHDDVTQSSMECAKEAACMQCDISEDNFGVHPCINPVTYYPAKGHCVTIYVAFANYSSPTDGAVAEDTLNPSDPYDWLSYDAAIRQLQTEQERNALRCIAENVRLAALAHVYVLLPSMALFGAATGQGHDHLDGEQPNALAVQPPNVTVVVSCGEPLRADEATEASRWLSDLLEELGVPENAASRYAAVRSGDLADAQSLTQVLAGHDIFLPAEIGEEKFLLVAPGGSGALHSIMPWMDDTAAACKATFRVISRVRVSPQLDAVISTPLAKQSERDLILLSEFVDVATSHSDALLLSGSGTTVDEEGTLSSQRRVAGLVQLLRGDDDPIPVLRNWQSAELLLSSVENSPFFVVNYRRKLPFKPSALHALLDETSWIAPESSPLVWVQGTCWLSTRFAYRAEVHVEYKKLVIQQGNPWWCTVAEDERPATEDTSSWSTQHGDRRQDIRFVFLRSSDDAALEIHLTQSLDAALCDSCAWRTWHRESDPFPAW